MKYRLLGPHTAPQSGERLEAGTEVGDDTPYPWKNRDGSDAEPSTSMEGLDDAARDKIKGLHQKLYGSEPDWSGGQSESVRQAREKEKEEQQKLDEGSEPVSEQQHLEREWDKEREKRGGAPRRAPGEPAPSIPSRGTHQGMHPRAGAEPGPAREPSHTASAAPTRSGATPAARGPATPKPPEGDEARPKNPNEDQYPKG
jgi:hypothetical protein